MAYYDLISENDESTVVAEFENGIFAADSPFMSEKNLEDQFVAQLGTQEYEFLPVGTEAELTGNLRHQLEQLNGVSFTDSEWKRFFSTFFAKHTILNILTRFCVFTVDNQLMVMRPYQIAATESILRRIKVAYNTKLYGKTEAGGYIWHTTGSGKTLTSFKTSLLASKLSYIDKVLFVVDRKDLDYQTMRE